MLQSFVSVLEGFVAEIAFVEDFQGLELKVMLIAAPEVRAAVLIVFEIEIPLCSAKFCQITVALSVPLGLGIEVVELSIYKSSKRSPYARAQLDSRAPRSYSIRGR